MAIGGRDQVVSSDYKTLDNDEDEEDAAIEMSSPLHHRHSSTRSNGDENDDENGLQRSQSETSINDVAFEPDDNGESNKRQQRARTWAASLYSITTILLYADQNLLAPNLTAVADEFGFNEEERDRKLGGDIALAFFLLGAPASLVVGCLADHYNHRSLLFALTVFIGEGACMLTYFTTSYTGLYICRAITGFSIGGAVPLIYSVLGDLFKADERHAVSAIVGMGVGIGISLGQGVAGFLGPTFGWRLPFMVVSVPALICAALVLFTVADPERGAMERVVLQQRSGRGAGSIQLPPSNSRDKLLHDEKSSSSCYSDDDDNDEEGNDNAVREVAQAEALTMQDMDDSNHSIPQDCLTTDRFMVTIIHECEASLCCGQTGWRKQITTCKSLLRTPSFLLLLAQGAPGCLPWGIINTYLNDYLSEDRGMSVEGATLVVLCFGAGSFGGLVLGGWGGRFLYTQDERLPSLLAGFAAIVACFPLWLLLNTVTSKSPYFYIVGVAALAGLGAGCTGPIVKATLQNVTLPKARGQAFAIFNTFDDFGRGLGPVFLSILISQLGGRTPAFNLGVLGWVCCGILNLLTFFTVSRDEQRVQAVLLATSCHAHVNEETTSIWQ